MVRKKDPMHYLQTTLFGNSIQDWIISLVVFAVSLLVATYALRALRRAVSKWALKAQTQVGEERVARACALITWAIPIIGFVLASHRLVLDKNLSAWIPIMVLITSQIVFLLILINIVPPLARNASARHLQRASKDRLEYHQGLKQSVEAVARRTKQVIGIMLVLVPLLTILSAIIGVPMAVWALPACVVFATLVNCRGIIMKAKRELKEIPTGETADRTTAVSEICAAEDDSEPCTTETIARYFLNLFKHQLGVPKGAPSEILLVEQTPSTNNYIYELRVRVGNELRTRRMTISPLGEEGGSRSKCFYVIYDDHLVIKIPPAHIEGLSHYLETLKKEAHIIDRLAMKECVIPRVSAILKRIHTFPDEAHFTPEEIEGRYIKWLIASPESQKYLKIGDTFAFFMDFSKYYFLQHIIEYLHDIEEKAYQEIRGHSEIIWDLATLENNYGPESLPVFIAIGEIYTRYEKRIKRLLTEYDLSSSVTPYQMRDWFFTYLAVSEVADLEKGLDPAFVADVNELLKNVMATHVKPTENYRNTARAIVSDKQFDRTRSCMAGLITNLIGLLARFRDRGVALRDLKPDNLLVAGDPGNYPAFLSHSDEYQIGIIDVETAVILGQVIEEPQLGGTPHYATPSHFFENDVLGNTFEDVPRTLHFQDWHAILIIIYRVVTGEPLFNTTAHLVPELVDMIRRSSGSADELVRVLRDVSRKFWGSAAVEFREKMASKAQRMKSVNVAISDRPKEMLKEYVFEQERYMAAVVRRCVMSQSLFDSHKNRQHLLSCSHEKITLLAKKYAKGAGTQASQPGEREQRVRFLQKLGRVKGRLEKQIKISDLLDQPNPVLSAYDLLDLMHHIVLRHMYRQKWGPLPLRPAGDPSASRADTSRK
ncbi:MAG: hypothetical protein SWQ30_19695 [Thermodesulfobacteriota bacterium]|nr:hypothetical protein [Thermodesulfobacteriota bacterium]